MAIQLGARAQPLCPKMGCTFSPAGLPGRASEQASQGSAPQTLPTTAPAAPGALFLLRQTLPATEQSLAAWPPPPHTARRGHPRCSYFQGCRAQWVWAGGGGPHHPGGAAGRRGDPGPERSDVHVPTHVPQPGHSHPPGPANGPIAPHTDSARACWETVRGARVLQSPATDGHTARVKDPRAAEALTGFCRRGEVTGSTSGRPGWHLGGRGRKQGLQTDYTEGRGVSVMTGQMRGFMRTWECGTGPWSLIGALQPRA